MQKSERIVEELDRYTAYRDTGSAYLDGDDYFRDNVIGVFLNYNRILIDLEPKFLEYFELTQPELFNQKAWGGDGHWCKWASWKFIGIQEISATEQCIVLFSKTGYHYFTDYYQEEEVEAECPFSIEFLWDSDAMLVKAREKARLRIEADEREAKQKELEEQLRKQTELGVKLQEQEKKELEEYLRLKAKFEGR